MKIAEIIAAVPQAHLVGGALRDALSGRPSPDIDLALPPKTALAAAKKLAKSFGGGFFVLDEETKVYRVTAPGGFQLDVSAWQGRTLAEDLKRRDFTINSLAYPAKAGFEAEFSDGFFTIKLGDETAVIDICGGASDLAKKIVAMTDEKVFEEDPLRLLRAFRIACELGFSVEPKTLRAIKKRAGLINRAAGERVREELMRLLSSPQAAEWLVKTDEAGILTAVLPELKPQKKCAEVYYGKGGVLKHTLSAVSRAEWLLASLEKVFPLYAEKLSDCRKKAALIKLSVLLHDLGKPETAKRIKGRLRFFGHEEAGAKKALGIMKKLRFSNSEAGFVCRVAREHLRPGNLASNDEITEKAVYRFFRDNGGESAPLLLACWADHASYMSPQGLAKILPQSLRPPFPLNGKKLPRQGPKKTLRHLQLIGEMLRLYFCQPESVMPQKLVDGKDVMKSLKLKPGPAVGEMLEAVRLAQVEKKITTRAEALEFLKLKKFS